MVKKISICVDEDLLSLIDNFLANKLYLSRSTFFTLASVTLMKDFDTSVDLQNYLDTIKNKGR